MDKVSSNFDYKGFSSRTLLELCNSSHLRVLPAQVRYWHAEIYSFGRWLRDYAHYPDFLPLYVNSDHGVDPYDEIPPDELETNAFCYLCHSPDKKIMREALTAHPTYIMPSPFVWCHKRLNICKSTNAKGTLVFYSHSTPFIQVNSDVDTYVKDLLNLPEKYQPICVMMHMHDVLKNVHDIFIKKGIPVYTAGHASDIRFAERFYRVLRNFRYSTSNSIGSYTLYSAEFGVPFFLFGPLPTLINVGDSNMPLGEYSYDRPKYNEASRIFSPMVDEVTAEQQAYVEYHLGLKNGISSEAMHSLLWQAYRVQGNMLTDILSLVNPWRILKPTIRLLIHRIKNS